MCGDLLMSTPITTLNHNAGRNGGLHMFFTISKHLTESENSEKNPLPYLTTNWIKKEYYWSHFVWLNVNIIKDEVAEP